MSTNCGLYIYIGQTAVKSSNYKVSELSKRAADQNKLKQSSPMYRTCSALHDMEYLCSNV